uniref:RNA-directed DNA polymerase n=1 Tax=Caenorhabditis japonica TaxID=281687 RepID=A0A8R1ELC7_CAEJA
MFSNLFPTFASTALRHPKCRYRAPKWLGSLNVLPTIFQIRRHRNAASKVLLTCSQVAKQSQRAPDSSPHLLSRWKANLVADALSREGSYVDKGSDGETKELLKVVNELKLDADKHDPLDHELWLEELRMSDEGWKELIEILKKGETEGKVRVKGIKGLVLVENYALIGRSLRNTEIPESNRKVVPKSAQNLLVEELHEGDLGGHFGAQKMLRQLGKRFFWPRMLVTMESCVKSCPKCVCTNDHPKLTAPLKPYETSYPMEIVACDLIDVGLSTQGNRYILSIIDLFTKYAIAVPIPDKKAETVVKAFIERWALGEGRIPDTLWTDEGKEFENSHFQQLCKMLQIKKVSTKGYNSRINGCVERFNKTIIHIIKKRSSVSMEWDDQIPFATFAYNSVMHRTTGESPMFLMHGRDSKHPIFMEGEDAAGIVYSDCDEYKTVLTQELLKAHRLAKEHAC